MTYFDADAALERIREFRAANNKTERDQDETDDRAAEPTDVRDLGARMYGKPYKGDHLAAIADRMFRR